MEEERIIKLQSVYKDYIWGGTKIRDVLKKDTGDMSPIAESWEVSTHSAGENVIASGMYKGKTLSEYFDLIGWKNLGDYCEKNHKLPILIKYIDAKENLSIQVHPDEKYAREHENDGGKNEMWIILGTEKNAFIYLGFNRDLSKEEIREHIKKNTLESVLNKVYVKKGETYFIPAGTVHAIGKGCLICEIQQPSNVTYRLYDYGRKKDDGTERELHIEKALEVVNCSAVNVAKISTLDTEKIGRYLKEMLAENGDCGFLQYDADGELSVVSTRKGVKFALVYSGKGNLICGNTIIKTSAGDSWLIRGQSAQVNGKCKVFIISL